MSKSLKSFKIYSKGKLLDYRLSENLNLDKVKDFFSKGYQIKKIWIGPRHILAVLCKDDMSYFLKLSTSEGISAVGENEYSWNEYFNNHCFGINFRVPKNYEKGFFERKYFYLITDYLQGDLLESDDLVKLAGRIIELSEIIQKLPGKEGDYRGKFVSKARAWFGDIPSGIAKKYDVRELLEIVERGTGKLSSKFRHGDFAPWHIIKLTDGRLGLIDGEHALADGVENYDICYLIQRIFSVSKRADIALEIYSKLLKRGYDKDKLKTVLAARAIGGFLDESLSERPDYKFAASFRDFVI